MKFFLKILLFAVGLTVVFWLLIPLGCTIRYVQPMLIKPDTVKVYIGSIDEVPLSPRQMARFYYGAMRGNAADYQAYIANRTTLIDGWLNSYKMTTEAQLKHKGGLSLDSAREIALIDCSAGPDSFALYIKLWDKTVDTLAYVPNGDYWVRRER